MSTKIVTLAAAPDSFPFVPKNITVSSEGVILGSAGQGASQNEPARIADMRNGWFGPLPASRNKNPLEEDVYPLSLSAVHAKLLLKDGQIYIRCMGAPFKTYVNGQKVTEDTLLHSGDKVSLGTKIPRNSHTPSSVTEDHLKPIIAVVSIL